LALDTTTGVISGTPTSASSTTTYTVTATNSGGSISFPIILTVNNAAPTGLSYSSPNVYTVGVSISNLVPTSTGIVDSYSVLPALPNGLTLDATTGIISGTPTTAILLTTYTVTATNAGGNISFPVIITINDAAPIGLSYDTPNVYTVNTPINLVPTVTGNVTAYTINGTLPQGVTFNPSTGIISGTPTVTMSAFVYEITATNSGGMVSFQVSIAVVDVAPAALSYPSPNLFHVGAAIISLTPTINGNVTNYSVAPALPDGLSMDNATGIISGTPTTITATSTYTVTATNSGGTASFGVIITVDEELKVDGNTFATLAIYPNPFTENVYLKGINADVNYTLFSVEGKFIKQGTPTNSMIALPDLPNGMYLLQLSSENKTKTVKMIKQ